jgi:glutathione S-transferase
MARVDRKIPGRNEYPGKHFIWTDEAERRLRSLIQRVMTMHEIANVLNKEFRQRVKLTKNSIVGKTFRMRVKEQEDRINRFLTTRIGES